MPSPFSRPVGPVLDECNPSSVLVVSPNPELRRDVTSRLQSGRWTFEEAGSGAAALQKLEQSPASLVLLDPGLPDLRVEEFRGVLQSEYPDVEIVTINPYSGQPVVTAHSPESLCFEIVRHLKTASPSDERPLPISHLSGDTSRTVLPGMVGTSAAMQRVYDIVRLVAERDTTILISGESGTGKDLVARAIHQLSRRHHKPFVVINCAAIPEALLEAELFGYVKGAFTGAVQSRIGRIHAAQGGTLFLDEIGELPIGLQSKLLRFLELGEIQRLGSSDTLSVNVRVVAATNAELRKLVQQHAFREDLYYRLSVFPIGLPPLRDRMSDLPPLAESFLATLCPHTVDLAPEAETVLMQHSWPGNVRELRNVMERASILACSGTTIRPEHILI